MGSAMSFSHVKLSAKFLLGCRTFLKKQFQLVDGPVQYMIGMTLTGGLRFWWLGSGLKLIRLDSFIAC